VRSGPLSSVWPLWSRTAKQGFLFFDGPQRREAAAAQSRTSPRKAWRTASSRSASLKWAAQAVATAPGGLFGSHNGNER